MKQIVKGFVLLASIGLLLANAGCNETNTPAVKSQQTAPAPTSSWREILEKNQWNIVTVGQSYPLRLEQLDSISKAYFKAVEIVSEPSGLTMPTTGIIQVTPLGIQDKKKTGDQTLEAYAFEQNGKLVGLDLPPVHPDLIGSLDRKTLSDILGLPTDAWLARQGVIPTDSSWSADQVIQEYVNQYNQGHKIEASHMMAYRYGLYFTREANSHSFRTRTSAPWIPQDDQPDGGVKKITIVKIQPDTIHPSASNSNSGEWAGFPGGAGTVSAVQSWQVDVRLSLQDGSTQSATGFFQMIKETPDSPWMIYNVGI